MNDNMDDARAALAELDKNSYGVHLNALIARCRPLLDPSDAERKLDEIRAAWLVFQEACAGSYDNGGAAIRFTNTIGPILTPPSPSFKAGDPVVFCKVSRTVIAVLDNGTLNLDAPGGVANFINVNATDCKRVKL